MPAIVETLEQFIADTGAGKPRSTASPASIIDLFGRYLDDYGHEDLNEFDSARFEKEYDTDRRFCRIFGPDHIQPHHLNSFVSTFVVRKVMGTKGFLKACGPLMERLAKWLRERGHWNDEDMAYFRDLVGDKAGADLVDCDSFGGALWEYAENHPVDAPDDLDDDDYLDDQFTIKKIEPGKLHVDALLEGEGDIVMSLPKPLTAMARTGWSVSLGLARLRGKWRILGVSGVYP